MRHHDPMMSCLFGEQVLDAAMAELRRLGARASDARAAAHQAEWEASQREGEYDDARAVLERFGLVQPRPLDLPARCTSERQGAPGAGGGRGGKGPAAAPLNPPPSPGGAPTAPLGGPAADRACAPNQSQNSGFLAETAAVELALAELDRLRRLEGPCARYEEMLAPARAYLVKRYGVLVEWMHDLAERWPTSDVVRLVDGEPEREAVEGAVETRFVDLFYLAGGRIGLRFEGILALLAVPDDDARRLVRALAGNEQDEGRKS